MTGKSYTDVSTRTKIRQQEQEQQEQQKKNDQDQRENHYYNNNYITRSQACSDLPGAEVMEKIAEAYHDNISREITHAAAMIIENALRHGMEPATVIMAIEETGLASKPSPYYLRAVLRNWAERGIVTSRVYDRWQHTNGMPWWRWSK